MKTGSAPSRFLGTRFNERVEVWQDTAKSSHLTEDPKCCFLESLPAARTHLHVVQTWYINIRWAGLGEARIGYQSMTGDSTSPNHHCRGVQLGKQRGRRGNVLTIRFTIEMHKCNTLHFTDPSLQHFFPKRTTTLKLPKLALLPKVWLIFSYSAADPNPPIQNNARVYELGDMPGF